MRNTSPTFCNNQTLHFEVHVNGQFDHVEKCRNTLGGFANMLERETVRLGTGGQAVLGFDLRNTTANPDRFVSRTTGTVVELLRVEKL